MAKLYPISTAHNHDEVYAKIGEGGVTRPVFLVTPLTSTAWDGDSFSTTAKTKIDLSDVFGVPAGVKAVLIRLSASDSASGTTNWLYAGVSPNSTAGSMPIIARPSGRPDNNIEDIPGICACDANGDIYYETTASGTNTMKIWIEIWGYWL